MGQVVGIVVLTLAIYYVLMSYSITELFNKVGKKVGVKTALGLPYILIKNGVGSIPKEEQGFITKANKCVSILLKYQLYAVVLVEIVVHDTVGMKEITTSRTTKPEVINTYKQYLQELGM